MEGPPEMVFPETSYPPEPDLPDRFPILERGAHPPRTGRACAMEAASWLAGEKWSDHPRSVHRAIASVARWVNDTVEEDERQRLWPLILASLDTASASIRIDRKLTRLARDAGSRATRRSRPVEAWTEVLAEHARLTGHDPAGVPRASIESLYDHLVSTRQRDPESAAPTAHL